MAITSPSGIVAGLKPPEEFLKVGSTMEAIGVMNSFAYTAGRPGAMAAPAAGVDGALLTTKAGQIPWSNPVAQNAYLAMIECTASVNGSLLLVDRIWENSGLVVTTTTAQAITSGAFTNRDRNGASLGDGIMVGLEVRTATTNGSAVTNMTLNYTDEANNDTQTGTCASFPATAVAGTFVPFRLAAGDSGVRSIQGITLGTSLGGGAVHLVAYRVLARVGCLATVTETKNWADVGLPRLYDDTVPSLLWVPSATTAVTIAGQIVYTHG